MVKIVPVDGLGLVNEQPQTQLKDMMAEVIISTELSSLASQSGDATATATAPGFLVLRRCNLIQGNYPPILLDKWDAYQADKGSDNQRPDSYLFPVDSMQKFVVLEMSNGGEDLENVVLNNAGVGLAIFSKSHMPWALLKKPTNSSIGTFIGEMCWFAILVKKQSSIHTKASGLRWKL